MDINNYADKLINKSLNESEDINIKKQTTFLLQINYLKKYGREISDDNRDIVPILFEVSDDWDKKTKILVEAINENKKIIDCKLYPTILEGYHEEDNIKEAH